MVLCEQRLVARKHLEVLMRYPCVFTSIKKATAILLMILSANESTSIAPSSYTGIGLKSAILFPLTLAPEEATRCTTSHIFRTCRPISRRA